MGNSLVIRADLVPRWPAHQSPQSLTFTPTVLDTEDGVQFSRTLMQNELKIGPDNGVY